MEVVLLLEPIEVDCQTECAFDAILTSDGLHDVDIGEIRAGSDKTRNDRVGCIILRGQNDDLAGVVVCATTRPEPTVETVEATSIATCDLPRPGYPTSPVIFPRAMIPGQSHPILSGSISEVRTSTTLGAGRHVCGDVAGMSEPRPDFKQPVGCLGDLDLSHRVSPRKTALSSRIVEA